MDVEELLNILDRELTQLEEIARIWLLYRARSEDKLKVDTFKEHYIVLENQLTGARYLIDPRRRRLIAVKDNGVVYVPHLGKLVPYKRAH